MNESINLIRSLSNQQRIREGSEPVAYPILQFSPPPPSKEPLSCFRRGLDIIDHYTCGSCGEQKRQVPVYACSKHGRCTLEKSFAGSTCCAFCDDREAVKPPISTISPPPSGAGVVLGFFGLPALARLQILTIRETCGDVPILIADDGSDKERELLDVTREFSGVEFWPASERMGHYAGDLSVFFKGIQWAAMRNLTWLCKLSQRMIWTRTGWLQSAIDQLKQSGRSVMMQNCWDNGKQLYIRSECVLFDVRDWIPHYREFHAERLNNPTELKMWHLVHTHFGAKYCTWAELPENRYQRAEGTIWHCTHTEQEFRNFASSKGVILDSDFHVNGAERMPGWKRG